jgi:hypothetical protein
MLSFSISCQNFYNVQGNRFMGMNVNTGERGTADAATGCQSAEGIGYLNEPELLTAKKGANMIKQIVSETTKKIYL